RTLRVMPLAAGEREWRLALPADAGQGRTLQLQAARNELAVFCHGMIGVVDLGARREVRPGALPALSAMAARAGGLRFLPDGRVVAVTSEPAGKGVRVATRDRESGTDIGPTLDIPRATGLLPLGDIRQYRLSDDARLLAVCPFPMFPSHDPV